MVNLEMIMGCDAEKMEKQVLFRYCREKYVMDTDSGSYS